MPISDDTYKRYAKYTMVFSDVLDLFPDTLNDMALDTEEHTKRFQDMLKAKYYNYEIAGETYGEFLEMLNSRFAQYKDYYIEFINAYETKINMLDGRKTTRSVTESRTRKANGSNDGRNTTNETYTDLPRSTPSQERPTNKTETSTQPHSEYTDNSSDEVTREASITGLDPQVELKKKYLDLIKNVYREFTEAMKPCFLTIFY